MVYIPRSTVEIMDTLEKRTPIYGARWTYTSIYTVWTGKFPGKAPSKHILIACGMNLMRPTRWLEVIYGLNLARLAFARLYHASRA